MRKVICRLLVLTCILAGLCGCHSWNSQPVSLEDSIPIPDDGIIAASVFEKLQQENKAVAFYGTSNGIRYEWTVFGSDIEEVKALNLSVVIEEADSEKVVFRYLSEENFGFSPVLSIYLNETWDVQSATVYEIIDAGITERYQAAVTGSDNSILNFSPEVQTGTYEILPDTVQDTAAPETESADESTSDTTQDASPAETESPGTAAKDTPQDTVSAGSDIYWKESELPLPSAAESNKRPISDGKQSGQDQYKTDPVPEGKPLPAEPEDQEIDTRKAYTCTFSIECSAIFNNLKDLDPDKLDVLPKNGIIFPKTTVTFYEGESVYDVLQRICMENNIHMESSWTPIYNSAYVEGIHNLYEFDCGSGSGWMYRVNGWYPNYGCSRYQLAQGDVVEWRYTCDLGADIGGGYAVSPE